MSKRIICLMAAFALVCTMTGCSDKKEKAIETSTATNVTVSEVKRGNVEATQEYTGEVKAASSASVSPKVAGNIRSINVEVGDYVRAGTVLATIDSTQYSLAYNQASAAYQSALAAKSNASAAYNNVKGGSLEQSKVSMNQAVANAQSAYNTALDNYNRQKALYDIGAVSKVALDSAKTSMDNAKNALDAANENARLNETVVIPQTEASSGAGVSQAEAGVSQAKAALDIAASNLANCNITAPISGYITSKNAIIGQMAASGMELFAIKNAEVVDIELNVTETVVSFVSVGTRASIDIDSAGLTAIEGTVSAVGKAKNDMTGMFPVKISIANKDDKIKVGMLAEVSLVTEGAENVIVADANSVIYKNGKYYVYVAEGSKAVRKDVEIGVTDGKYTEIVSGLDIGDKVIVDGKDFISDKNNEIKIVK
ncbi:MAG: efflux RND transporter periplasmic adaptor subunit [Clostridia bacterium]|nr:efflux RND transporter periplasmic adaptor subunit [Clostridia bacterium]